MIDEAVSINLRSPPGRPRIARTKSAINKAKKKLQQKKGIKSQIWDLTRYGESGHEFYLKNLNICCTRLKFMEKNVIWVTTSPVDDKKTSIFT
ncbi:unnamed protein product [Rotaria sordida]|uniref:Uncharacterized protein n=1 Tax=Rotaria sordida TaxID=392033 RepID=A0A818W6I9_9BILA|nr:unnamed protein product [Rotaria sordida]